MTRFLRLTHLIVNTTKIVTIDISPTKYTMYMSNQTMDGWFFVFSGTVESIHNKIEICKNKHSTDYQIVKEWIRRTTKESPEND